MANETKPKYGWVRNIGGVDLFEDFELRTEPRRSPQGGVERYISGSHLPGILPFRLKNPPAEPNRIYVITY